MLTTPQKNSLTQNLRQIRTKEKDMRLIDGNKLFKEIANEKCVAIETTEILKKISEQETALSVTDLIVKVGSLDTVGINGIPHVSLKDVLNIISRK